MTLFDGIHQRPGLGQGRLDRPAYDGQRRGGSKRTTDKLFDDQSDEQAKRIWSTTYQTWRDVLATWLLAALLLIALLAVPAPNVPSMHAVSPSMTDVLYPDNIDRDCAAEDNAPNDGFAYRHC